MSYENDASSVQISFRHRRFRGLLGILLPRKRATIYGIPFSEVKDILRHAITSYAPRYGTSTISVDTENLRGYLWLRYVNASTHFAVRHDDIEMMAVRCYGDSPAHLGMQKTFDDVNACVESEYRRLSTDIVTQRAAGNALAENESRKHADHMKEVGLIVGDPVDAFNRYFGLYRIPRFTLDDTCPY